jgi:hypothetical protein
MKETYVVYGITGAEEEISLGTFSSEKKAKERMEFHEHEKKMFAQDYEVMKQSFKMNTTQLYEAWNEMVKDYGEDYNQFVSFKYSITTN